ncbi:hypothetical protein KP509_29G082200 [Ceratopteris richardii]|uniref:30S ribosomal protein 3, chloroplastic n=1 Tax=Ceratopteris richardii TaxID=49495 RepID=A0A8T2RB38_CERRI|nr:hypothetical protein KP509_29G082200 [Ceratopteris richardii]
MAAMASTIVSVPSSSSSLSSASAWRGSSLSYSHQLPPASNRQGLVISADLDASPSSPVALTSRSQKGRITGKKPQVMLKFVWMDKNIGIGLDQVVPGHGTVPLTSYYFWPRKDAWEEIKIKLESKKWISRKQTILLLNQATDVINLWQQNATG